MSELFLTLLISISILLLGALVISRNGRATSNQAFFFMTVSGGAWILANHFANYQNGMALTFTRLTFLAGIFVSYFLLWFVASFSQRKLPTFVKYLLASFFITLSSVVFFSNLIVEDVTFIPSGTGVISGRLYLIYPVALLLTIFSSSYLVTSYYRSKGARVRQQISFMILGLIASATFITFTNILLPAIFKNDSLSQIGPFGLLIFTSCTTYAIIKHRLMDIRMVVARSVAYAILLALMAGFYGAAIFAAQAFIFPEVSNSAGYVALQIVLAVIMAFTFQPLRRWITKVTDKIFFKHQYDPEQFLDTLAHTIGSTIVLVELMFKALDLIREQIKVSRGIMVILNESGTIYNSQSFGYKEGQEPKAEDMAKLAHDGILVYDELDEHSQYKRLLRKYDAAIAIPLKTEGKAQGVLLLGEKLSGDMYSGGDLKVFEIVAPELAVAITNAKSYEKIEKFNVTLRQEIKKATAELERKNEQLRELDKAKDEFISMASHQLRTPLTAIKGYLSMLLEGDAGEIKVSQYDFVNEAFQGANRMVGLINDLLNVSRMETGRFFLEPVDVDLERLVEEEMKQLSNHAKEKKLSLKLEKKGKIPRIWADETKIRQVVMNFMDNAIYYTTKGTVTVSLHADKSHVIYEVTDTGIGVPKAQQKNLFTKFYRADNARHVRPDGTGLGIYLAKKVMDDHGGELIFRSVEGKGSTFGFKFPLNSKLKLKRISAPTPREGAAAGPALGELAAGIGVSAESLAATSKHVDPIEEVKRSAAELEDSLKAQKASLEAIGEK